MEEKTKIFVDGNCIICDMEISHYKRIAPELFDIVDISQPGFDAAQFDLSPEEVNRNMHVLTPGGEVRIGVDAFAHIWDRIGKYNFAAKLVRNPLVNPAARMAYRAFASVRPYLPKRK